MAVCLSFVMPALDAGIHASLRLTRPCQLRGWPGRSPVM